MLPSYSASRYDTKKSHNVPQVKFSTADEVQNSKDCRRTILLIILSISLAAATTTGGVAVSMRAWWTQTRSGESFKWVEVGLWETCSRKFENETWVCNKYNTQVKEHETPFKDMDLVQKCMITATAAIGLAFLINFLTILGRLGKLFKVFLYSVSFLSLTGAVLFALCVGYTSAKKKKEDLVPSWVVGISGTLKLSVMFYIACAASGCAFISVIMTFVACFINDDEDAVDAYNKDHMDSISNPGKENLNAGYDQSMDFEREISRRGKGYVNQDAKLDPLKDYSYITPNIYRQADHPRQKKPKHDRYKHQDRYSHHRHSHDQYSHDRYSDRHSQYDDSANYHSDVQNYHVDRQRPRSSGRTYDNYGNTGNRSAVVGIENVESLVASNYYPRPRSPQQHPEQPHRRTAPPSILGPRGRNTPDYVSNSRDIPMSNYRYEAKERNGPFDDYDMYFNSPY